MGKKHGSLTSSGKVRGMTPKVEKQQKKRKPCGRALKREQYIKRVLTPSMGFGAFKKRSPNSQQKQ